MASSSGELASVWPVLRARYSDISHVAWPSITASRAMEPSSLLRPCWMNFSRLKFWSARACESSCASTGSCVSDGVQSVMKSFFLS